ncbi:MAG: response regulator transcription factor [Pirellulaceae bacterium]|nr:response regulator transcription factor [Pirellulaceae bacterium]
MANGRILTIEDDPAIRRGIVDALRFAGYDVLEAADGAQALEMALRREYDLLLLDLVLPPPDGFEILARLRRDRPTVPIIVLTARGEEADRVRGLRDGADDYVVKPFSVRELLARVDAVLRRTPGRPEPIASIGIPGGRIDLARREVCFDDGRRDELSEREADLLGYLAAHRGRALSRDELLANVWRIPPRGLTTRTIDMHVARLREKIERDPARPAVIFTVRGKGYRFARDTESLDDDEV